MNASVNRQWRVVRHARAGEPVTRELFRWEQGPIPQPRDGEFVVKTHYLAPGPAQRGYLREPVPGAFFEPVGIDEVMRGRGVGRIVSSRHPDYPVGGVFVGSLGWQDYSIQKPRGKEFIYSTRLVSDPLPPLSNELATLGQAGVTAYFGLHEAGRLQKGDNVVVSAAAGGVGSVAGQIARIEGANRVIGIAGGPTKCNWLTETLGFDAAIDYRNEDVNTRLAALCPDGVDVFFDCVGGDILNTVLGHLAIHARVAIAGYIATDYDPAAKQGPINYRNLVSRRATMQGFVFFDYWDRYDEAAARLRSWHEQGLLHNTADIVDGLEAMPDALAGLFTGDNKGVSICRVSDDE